ncbi:NAD(P)H-dependent oxidoreductase [Clostridium sp. 'White wine YQ']|uniref:NAD(P)H-dependent oxidoreductase n=1 Tax=Clostridium sp. 'White wine YQ' TaxID=3027474 RepID=UPI002365C5CF|nr:NAD(P)H-dependent oxidoreductase [Clostridium sp. 'White wine YQ']MDD7793188.1 NAD(P)H-dependent oxidoreductase [Clostridium sp. 'White wine YQ']
MSIEKSKILDAYNFRHACKEFDENKKISDDDFNFILETARLSPSSFGFEPWKLLIVQNKDLRDKLKPITWGAQRQLPTASHFVIILARKKDEMIYNSEYIHNFMEDIQKLPNDILTGKTATFENFQKNDFNLLENDRYIFDWASKQTYILLGNILTSAALIGIDSCPIEGYDIKKVEDLLEKEGVLDKTKFGVSVMAAFGYRKNTPREKTRQSIDKITEWIK